MSDAKVIEMLANLERRVAELERRAFIVPQDADGFGRGIQPPGQTRGSVFDEYDAAREQALRHVTPRDAAAALYRERASSATRTPGVRPVCECSSPAYERLGTWNDETRCWDCRSCGGVITPASVRSELPENPARAVNYAPRLWTEASSAAKQELLAPFAFQAQPPVRPDRS